ncbi:unnamed protein product [Clonostachys rosea]|uniref:Transcription factor TFIIIC triple barrel domain-containing protein n=1 Tax=Bionectria ochroleuca TaxID=29856 RepID=A0ABY6TUN7_BIOOC|nr:unnamed protein product [Clonostachys rosea]
MSLECIYVVRHGFRGAWNVDPRTGVYSTTVPTPTGIAADPALTSHGTRQAEELGRHLMTVDPAIDVVYSSPYYRCLQTISPFVELRRGQVEASSGPPPDDGENASATSIRTEHGLGEWFGLAPFDHPQPAPGKVLKEKFPTICEDYSSITHAPIKGETLGQLYERVATAVRAIIERCDNEGKRAVVLCTHAAVVITLGRVLTGCIPEDPSVQDFGAFTCGLSVFKRQAAATGWEKQQQDKVQCRQAGPPVGEGEVAHVSDAAPAISDESKERPSPLQVVPPWRCKSNSDCSFLSSGAERGWMFFGDESFLELGPLSQATSFGTKL